MSCAHGAKTNFGDLTTYLTYDHNTSAKKKLGKTSMGQPLSFCLCDKDQSYRAVLECSVSRYKKTLNKQIQSLLTTVPLVALKVISKKATEKRPDPTFETPLDGNLNIQYINL
jgi:hypothetical protein